MSRSADLVTLGVRRRRVHGGDTVPAWADRERGAASRRLTSATSTVEDRMYFVVDGDGPLSRSRTNNAIGVAIGPSTPTGLWMPCRSRAVVGLLHLRWWGRGSGDFLLDCLTVSCRRPGSAPMESCIFSMAPTTAASGSTIRPLDDGTGAGRRPGARVAYRQQVRGRRPWSGRDGWWYLFVFVGQSAASARSTAVQRACRTLCAT